MSDWFSNKGQALQVAIGTASLIVATTVAIQQSSIPAFWALIAVPIGSLLVWRLARGSRAPAQPNTLTDAPPPTMTPSPPIQSTTSTPAKTQKAVDWQVFNISLPAGQRWRRDSGTMQRYEVRLLSVAKSKTGASLAEVEVTWALGRLLVGENVTTKSESTFLIPESKSFDTRTSIVACVFTKELMRAFALRIDHIDSHSKTAELEISLISGFDG